jgi:hypothetical protein
MVQGIALLISGALALLTWYGYVPPYRWIAALQSALWGVDIVNISLLVTMGLFYAPLSVVAEKIGTRLGIKRDPVTWQKLGAMMNFFFETWPGKVAGIGFIIASMGGYFWSRYASAGPLTELTMQQADNGEKPSSRYLRLKGGTILFDNELSFERNRTVEHYYPVVSAPQQTRVRVFVRLDPKYRSAPPTELTGEIEYDGLPGPLRSHVDELKLLGPDSFVIRHGWDPHHEQESALKGILFGLALFVAGLLWAVWARAARKGTSDLP